MSSFIAAAVMFIGFCLTTLYHEGCSFIMSCLTMIGFCKSNYFEGLEEVFQQVVNDPGIVSFEDIKDMEQFDE
jgi:hypothetical protein